MKLKEAVTRAKKQPNLQCTQNTDITELWYSRVGRMEDGKCESAWAESSLIVGGQHLMLKTEKAKNKDKSILFKDMKIMVKLIGF